MIKLRLMVVKRKSLGITVRGAEVDLYGTVLQTMESITSHKGELLTERLGSLPEIRSGPFDQEMILEFKAVR